MEKTREDIEIERFAEYLQDLADRKISAEDFAEKWYVYMNVSRSDAESYFKDAGKRGD